MRRDSIRGTDAELDAILARAGGIDAAARVEAGKADAWRNVEMRTGCRGAAAPVAPVWRRALRVAAVMIPLAFALILAQKGGDCATTTYYAAAQADTFALPDGSTVVLGKGSELAFANGGDLREARLSGIALFRVRHDEAAPFVVNADEARVRVLGTTFCVEHWPGEERVRTRVEQGHVKMSAGDADVDLLAGEEATWSGGMLTKQTSAMGTISIDSRAMTFRAASLKQVVEELKTCYHGELKGVSMECADDSVLITTSFYNQTLESVVEELNMHFDKKLTLSNGYLTISD